MDFDQIREFGTGLRDYLELHGAQLGAPAMASSNADLFVLFGTPVQLPEPVLLKLRPASLAA
jgi:hypothetical protein